MNSNFDFRKFSPTVVFYEKPTIISIFVEVYKVFSQFDNLYITYIYT